MERTLSAAATAAHFLAIPFETRTGCNWRTAFDNSVFDLNSDAYINGFLTHVDFDYQGMYVVEIVERTDPSLVSWLAIAYGTGAEPHVEWFPCAAPQPFFDRTVDHLDVVVWALGRYRSLQAGSDVDGEDGRSSQTSSWSAGSCRQRFST